MKRAVLIAATVVACALTVGPVAQAVNPHEIAISGTTSTIDPGTGSCVFRGPYVLNCDSLDFLTGFAGTLTGTSSTDSSVQINCKTLQYHGHGVETFNGSLTGVGSGTLTWQLQTSGTVSDDCSALTSFEGRGVVVSGTGDLAGLNGTLTFEGDTYSGSLH